MTLPQMTPDEKWIAVAEFDGWCNCFIAGGDRDYKAGEIYGYYLNKDYCIALPDYLNDLNAIVKAVKKLNKEQLQTFVRNLKSHVGSRLLNDYNEQTYWIDATPHEIVDALLLTIGKATL